MKINKKINPKSLENLNPKNRLQSDVPKKRVNITIDKEILHILKQTGNVSGTIEMLVTERVNQEHKTKKIEEIKRKIADKETGYKANSASKIIQQVQQLDKEYSSSELYLIR